MFIKSLLFFVVLLTTAVFAASILFVANNMFVPTPVFAQGPAFDSKEPDYVPGEVLVKFKPQAGSLGIQRALQVEGVRVLKVSQNSGVMRLQVVPGRENETIARLKARGGVEYAIPNYRIEALIDPNDSSYNLQWALEKINAPQAWDIHTGGSDVVIAVIDTGTDLDHPDLAAKLWINSGEIPGNGVDDDGNNYTDDVNGYDFINGDDGPNDDHGHGTHVSGIAAASTNNVAGIAGVSWGAKVMPLKILSSSGGGSIDDLAEAIYYAVDNGAQVINLSVGARYSKWPCGWSNVEDAFDYALGNNVLVIVASGNDGQNGVNCPGAYDQVMAVGSTTSSDTRSSFSNYGPRLDIVAPGSGIYSTYFGSYTNMSGTSMATPHVAGLAALIWSVDPSLTSNQVGYIIQNTPDDLVPMTEQGDSCADDNATYSGQTGWDPCFGHGRINAYQALKPFMNLLETSGQPVLPPVTFLADDIEANPIPTTKSLQLVTTMTSEITWTATISPGVPWVNVTPPATGQISMASAGQFMLTTTKPVTYGIYTTTLVVTGTTSTGLALGPIVNEVHLNYLPELQRYYFPLILKN